MAQGNLTKQNTLQTVPINYSGNGKMGALVKSINSIIESMYEAGREFNNATDTPCKRMFYVGADSYLKGRKCANYSAELLNKKGNVLVGVRSFNNLNQDLR